MARPTSVASMAWADESPSVPTIKDSDTFTNLLDKLSYYIQEAVHSVHSWEDFQTAWHSRTLTPLVEYLSNSVHHRCILHALLALKGHFAVLEADDNRGINESRGYACEYVAWRFVTQLSGREALDFLLYELPSTAIPASITGDEEHGTGGERGAYQPGSGESTPLLSQSVEQLDGAERLLTTPTAERHALIGRPDREKEAFSSSFENLNALEIAAVTEAKKFLSQKVVQRMIEGIWRGDIIFWETLSVNTKKEAKVYSRKRADPFSRLRVPRYLKAYEAIFFLSFLGLYYAVLVPVQRNSEKKPHDQSLSASSPGHRSWLSVNPQSSFRSITPAEVLLYVWVVGFAYDEFGEYIDAGQAFYAADFWSLWDIGIVAIGIAFFICRIVGLAKASDTIIDTAFDILSLEALFIVPRICSVLSLNPYFGTLIPCLREMTKDFVKFLSLVIILYLGFLTTFTLLARDNFTAREMSWVLIKVFFGSSYLGFDVAKDISPVLGPPLMLVFVCMTNILLITSLISLLSNSLTRVLNHAREEYLFVYSVYVLEASTSNRLTYFFPPLNLIPLFLRPLRLFFAAEQLRGLRILLLKITHAPLVAVIWSFENLSSYVQLEKRQRSQSLSSLGAPTSSMSVKKSFFRASKTYPRAMMPAALNQGSLAGAARTSRSATNDFPRPAPEVPDEASADMRSLVLKLSSQVEQLTALVAEQQQHGRDSPDQDAG